jgi:hypothetical protein
MSSVPEMIESLRAYVQSAERICPKPDRWNDLWEILPDRQQQGTGWDPPLPLLPPVQGNGVESLPARGSVADVYPVYPASLVEPVAPGHPGDARAARQSLS